MFTYGYLREAVMAHLDLDESEAQAMNILSRLHIFANEAMQAICSNKPMYNYLTVKVVKEFKQLVEDNDVIREATDEEILRHKEDPEADLGITFLTEESINLYNNKNGLYKVFSKVAPGENFIAFADKQAYKIEEYKPTIEDLLNEEAFGTKIDKMPIKKFAKIGYDFAYIGKNLVKFYKPGEYYIPAKYLWFRFDSGISDDTVIDMPSDIFLTIPLYIASICLQIDNPQKATIKRSEFELALSRCTSTDFMPLNEIKASW